LIELREVTRENYGKISALAVREDQEGLVSPIQKTLADAYVYKEAILRIAYDGSEPIGYVLLIPYEEDGLNKLNITRLLIDQRFQGQGLGRKVLETTLGYIRTLEPAIETVRISTKLHNAPALALYRSSGFIEQGTEKGEVEMYQEL